ncbi:MAG: sulfatase [Candidatus Sumerlaeota bacterium]|nr:sulfatase [Candidatus Sumerlaeota bacterium]
MKRRDFLKTIPASVALLTWGQRRMAAAPSKTPNLLFIFCDQLRACELGCMGNPRVRTPNLDRLASQGLLMRNNYSCAPVCSPYRGQLQTGRYPWRNGVTCNGAEINPGIPCLAEVLDERGYATGFIGKWHLYRGGREKGTPEHEFVPPDQRRGWQYWAATNEGQKAEGAVYYTDKPEPIPIPGTEIELQTKLAIDYLEQRKDKPFALMIAYNPPHTYLEPTIEAARYADGDIELRPNVPEQYRAEALRLLSRYVTTVTVIDDYIGKLMAAVDRLGLSGNTIFVFTSDHGYMMYSQGQTDKQRPWEESAHTPFIVRYPAAIAAGGRSDAMINSVDIMPTVLGLMGAPIPPGVDGRDFSPLMRGEPFEEPEAVYLSQRHFGEGPGFDWQGVATREWKYARHKDGDWVMYSRKDDPYELKNLVADPAFAPMKAQLAAMTDAWRDKTGDTEPLTAQMRLPTLGELSSPDYTPGGKGGREGGEGGRGGSGGGQRGGGGGQGKKRGQGGGGNKRE